MYPHSARMDDAVRNGGTVAFAIEIYEGANQVQPPAPLNPIGGSVITDVTDSRTKRATLQLIDDSGKLSPSEARDLFSPLSGRNFVPKRGFDYLDGGPPELIPQGRLMITGVDTDETDSGLVISITGADDSERVSGNKYVEPVLGAPPGYIPAGLDVGDQLTAIWMERFSGLGNQGTRIGHAGFPTTRTIPPSNQDPWELMREMASAIGWRVMLDNDGVTVGAVIPDPYDPNAEVVWEYHDDRTRDDKPIVQRIATQLRIDKVFSGVEAEGQNSYGLIPPRAMVWDTNPASPTYYLGNFPRRVYVRPADEKIRTRDQAIVAATGDLNKSKGLPQVVQINQLVHPALTVDDVIRCDFTRSDIHGLYATDRIEMPFALDGPMMIRTRERRIGV